MMTSIVKTKRILTKIISDDDLCSKISISIIHAREQTRFLFKQDL